MTEDEKRAPIDAVAIAPTAIPGHSTSSVRFKGWRGGILVGIAPDAEWDEAIAVLCDRLAAAREFWEGAPCTLDLGPRELPLDAFDILVNRLSQEFSVDVVRLVCASEGLQRHAGEKDIAASSELPASSPVRAEPVARDQARYLKGTVRSGMVIESPGNLLVVGDVNAGAELRAGGDIVVFGTLRGVAHAGKEGDLAATISAINLRPTQLRIAGLIARAPDQAPPSSSNLPEKALVEDGEIHIRPM